MQDEELEQYLQQKYGGAMGSAEPTVDEFEAERTRAVQEIANKQLNKKPVGVFGQASNVLRETEKQKKFRESGILGKIGMGITSAVEGIQESPFVKYPAKAVGAAVGAAGGVIGGAVGAAGTPIANVIKGRPLFENLGKNIAQTASETAGFGYETGETGTKVAPLAGLGKIPSAIMAAPELYEGVKEKDPGKLAAGVLGVVGAKFSKGKFIDPELSAGLKTLKQKGLTLPKFGKQVAGDASKQLERAAQVYEQAVNLPLKLKQRLLQKGKSAGSLLVENEIPLTHDPKTMTYNTSKELEAMPAKFETPEKLLEAELDTDPSKKFSLSSVRDAIYKQLDSEDMLASERLRQKAHVDEFIQPEIEARGDLLSGKELNSVKRGMWGLAYDMGNPTRNELANDMGHIIKRMIEEGYPDANIKRLNAHIGDLADTQRILQTLNGRKVPGGVLGKEFSRIGSMIVGASTKAGPFATYTVGKVGELLNTYLRSPERITMQAITKFKKAGIMPEGIKTIEEAKQYLMNDLKNKLEGNIPKQLPAPGSIPLPEKLPSTIEGEAAKSGVTAEPAQPQVYRDPKTGRMQRGYTTEPLGFNKGAVPQTAFGGVAGIETEYDENGNPVGIKFDPLKGALGVVGMSVAGKVKGLDNLDQTEAIANVLKSKKNFFVDAVNKGKLTMDEWAELDKVSDLIMKGKAKPAVLRNTMELMKKAGVDIADEMGLSKVSGFKTPAVGETVETKLYHGTNAKFDNFDIEKSKRGVFGKGIYLTDDSKIARNYGENIKEFITDNKLKLYKSESRAIKEKDYKIIKDLYKKETGKELKIDYKGLNKEAGESDLFWKNINGQPEINEAKEIWKKDLTKKGYDGVKENDTYAIFNQEKLKTVDPLIQEAKIFKITGKPRESYPGLDTVGKAKEKAAFDNIENNFDSIIKKWASLEDSKGGRLINVDDFRSLVHDEAKFGKYIPSEAQTVHEPVSALGNYLKKQKIDSLKKDDIVGWMAGAPGHGKGTAIRNLDSKLYDNMTFGYDSVMANPIKTAADIQAVLDKGGVNIIDYVFRGIEDGWLQGVIGRAKGPTRRTLPLNVYLKGAEKAWKTIIENYEKFSPNPRNRFNLINNLSSEKNKAFFTTIEEVKKLNYTDLEKRYTDKLTNMTNDLVKKGELSPELRDSLLAK
jgi:hypothetical protein